MLLSNLGLLCREQVRNLRKHHKTKHHETKINHTGRHGSHHLRFCITCSSCGDGDLYHEFQYPNLLRCGTHRARQLGNNRYICDKPIAVANTATNGNVSLTNNGQDVRRAFTATTSVDSPSVYLKADITVTSANAAGDYFLHLGDNTATIFNARTYIRSSGAGFQMALGTASGTATYGTTVLNFNQTYTILARYDFVAGAGNDTGDLFVNPTTADGSGNTPYVAATTIGTDAVTISSVSLRQGTAANAPGLVIDNLSVAIVPEPSTALLGGLGLLALLRRRR